MSVTMEKLFAVMDRLEATDFKRFKTFLHEKNELCLQPLARGQLETCDSTELAKKMQDAYSREECSLLVLHILHKMNKINLMNF